MHRGPKTHYRDMKVFCFSFKWSSLGDGLPPVLKTETNWIYNKATFLQREVIYPFPWYLWRLCFFIKVKFTWHVVYHFKVYNSLEFSSFMILCNHYTCVLSHLVLSDALQPHGLQPTRLLCIWGYSRQEYWSELPCPPSGDLPNPGIEPRSVDNSIENTDLEVKKHSQIAK